jgi:hypothetical protein
VFKNTFFVQLNQGFSGLINCNPFSVVPSIISENLKKHAFSFKILSKDFKTALPFSLAVMVVDHLLFSSGNTKGGSITVPLTFCFTGLELAV